MTSAQQGETLAVPALTLDSFFEHVLYTNPFDVNRVGLASMNEADDVRIHAAPFLQLLELAEKARTQERGIGAVLWGEAGIGKSHLLARLARWAGPGHEQAIFIYLCNLQAAPEHLPRSLLKCVVSILTMGRTRQFVATPLFRLLNAALKQALELRDVQHPTWRSAESAYQKLIDGLCDAAPARAAVVDRHCYTVLFRFFRSVYRASQGQDDGRAALAVRWLAGEALDHHEARALDLPPGLDKEEGVALADDQQIQNVLIALAQLASYRGKPLILCFDQVDNLEPEQFSALARFLHALLDNGANLLVINAGLQATFLEWKTKKVIQDSSHDRLAQHQIVLQRIGVQEGLQIVRTRLRSFQEPYRMLEPIENQVRKDALFPLGKSWEQEYFGDKIHVRPRDVLNWARAGWRLEQEALDRLGGADWLKGWESRKPEAAAPPELTEAALHALIDQKVALKLQEHKHQRQLEPHTLPPDADNLTGLIHTLLQRGSDSSPFPMLLGVDRPRQPAHGQRPPYDLVLRKRLPDGTEVREGLLCLLVENRKSMAAFLRRLVQDEHPPERVLLVSDERRPLDPAVAGQEYLQQIRQRWGEKFRHVCLTFDQYAELDALQVIVGLARAGDLEIDLPGGQARQVGEQEVNASPQLRQRFLAHPLLRLLLTEEDTPAVPAKPLASPSSLPAEVPDRDGDVRDFIRGRLAITMGSSSQELAVQLQHHLEAVQGTRVELPACKSRLEEVAMRMHQEGLLNATSHDDFLYLLLK